MQVLAWVASTASVSPTSSSLARQQGLRVGLQVLVWVPGTCGWLLHCGGLVGLQQGLRVGLQVLALVLG
ncbi:hypothetical protein CR64_05300 [Pseudomonas aeruginosa]|nr:hypothetical protein CR64_05300 [Pseudomonas aeruginosa]